MKISSFKNSVSFQRKLTQNEIGEYSATLKKAKEITGQTGKTIFIMPSSNLPQGDSFNSGIGSISSDYAQDYFDYMKNYLDFNVVEDLPAGQIKPIGDFYCSYISSSFALGNQQINPELLATEQFANLLTQDDLKEIVSGNDWEYKDSLSNFKNVASNNGKQNIVLKKAFERFLKLEDENPLKKRFIEYCKENSYWLDFDRVDEPSNEFFKFKQFLADEHLKIGKEKLNSKGIKLCGDCLLRFSRDEINAFPDAFKKDCNMGLNSWGIPSLDFDKILDSTSDAYKLLKAKIQLFAKRYDMIRFDVGWGYVTPLISKKNPDGSISVSTKELGSSLLYQIEKWVKEIKGQDFNLKDLIWEFEAGSDEFQAFENDKLIFPLQDRVKVYGSTYIHKKPEDSWGFNQAFLKRGWKKDEYVLGVGNHDPQPLVQIAKGVPDVKMGKDGKEIKIPPYKKDSIDALSDILKIDKEALENPRTFVDAKWAETMSSYNTQMFYMDVFGREERFDMQEFNLYKHPHKNYAYKVSKDYENAFHDSLQNGLGFNPMRALELNFKAYKLDKKYPDIYKKVKKFAKILEAPDGIFSSGLGKKVKFAVIGACSVGAIFATLFTANKIKNKNNIKKSENMPQAQIFQSFTFEEFKQKTKNSNLPI